MFSIKVKDKNEWKFLGNAKGQPLVYANQEAAQKALDKLDKKLEGKVVGAMPVFVK
jgi:dsRNA-specific ribonuclease